MTAKKQAGATPRQFDEAFKQEAVHPLIDRQLIERKKALL